MKRATVLKHSGYGKQGNRFRTKIRKGFGQKGSESDGVVNIENEVEVRLPLARAAAETRYQYYKTWKVK